MDVEKINRVASDLNRWSGELEGMVEDGLRSQGIMSPLLNKVEFANTYASRSTLANRGIVEDDDMYRVPATYRRDRTPFGEIEIWEVSPLILGYMVTTLMEQGRKEGLEIDDVDLAFDFGAKMMTAIMAAPNAGVDMDRLVDDSGACFKNWRSKGK